MSKNEYLNNHDNCDENKDDLKNIKFEVCVDSLSSCIEAIKGGAGRLELCSSLFSGGLTPSYGLMKTLKEYIEVNNNNNNNKNNNNNPIIDVFVMIRPRSGDFLYNQDEITIMKHDIELVKQISKECPSFSGIVIGLLNSDGTIDKQNTEELVQLASPLSVTFHRAFDMSRNYIESFNTLKSINCDGGGKISRILTSGLESSVLEGIDTIKDLIKLSKPTHITILPGGGITQKNINKIIKKTKLQEYHISGRTISDSKMQFRNTSIFMGGSLRESEYSYGIVDKNKIQDFINKSNI
ncbi:hypothetical protein RB653_008143 [Dictyostelium firmibasis]|uniref:Copper homeostasis protein cutC homolog n=1 Tax=Dictyostelium firmibasis TaxID=79012 RepID=A0AAN7TYD9_9MYCE